MSGIPINIIVLCLVFLLVPLYGNIFKATTNWKFEKIKAKINTVGYSKHHNKKQPGIEKAGIVDENTKVRHLIKRSTDKNIQNDKPVSLDKFDLDYYYAGNHCSHVGDCASNIQKTLPVCYCDVYCAAFNDCCYDASNPEMASEVEKEHYVKVFEQIECNHNERLYGADDTIGYYFVQKCPSHYTNLEVQYKCESSNVTQPVTSVSDGITYSNGYCALCNNVTKYQYWNTVIFRLSCARLDLFSINGTNVKDRLAFLKEQCHLWRFTPNKNSKPRVCRDFSLMETDSCPNFVNPIRLLPEKSLYRNHFCIPASRKNSDYTCLFSNNNSPYEKGFGSQAVTILFQMHPPILAEETKKCQNRETYLADLDTCFPDECGNWNIEDECSIEAYANHEITLKMILSCSSQCNADHALRVITSLYQYIPKIYKMTVTRVWGDMFFCCNRLLTLASFKVQRKLSLTNLKTLSTKLQSIKLTYHEFNNGTRLTLRRLKMTKDDNHMNYTCLENERKRYSRTRIDFLETWNIMSINVTEIDKFIPKELEIESHLEVSMVTNKLLKITINEVSSKHPNNSSFSGVQDVVIVTGGESHVQGLITYVCMCISCLFLVFTICLYVYTNMHKSAPGLISVHMMVTLLLSQIMFMAGIDASDKGYELCLVIGILSHYLWLTTFVWVCLFMVHITRTILKVNFNPNSSTLHDKRISVTNYVIGYGAAWVIVIPSVILELCQFSHINIGYTSVVCFPTGYPGNLIVFTGPVFLCLLINCFMLVANISVISYYQKPIRSQSFDINRSYLLTYVKLCFISSCPWLLGLLGEIVQSDYLRYIFIVLSSLHGFIVSLCFLFSERVFKLLQRQSSKAFGRIRSSSDISKSHFKLSTVSKTKPNHMID